MHVICSKVTSITQDRANNLTPAADKQASFHVVSQRDFFFFWIHRNGAFREANACPDEEMAIAPAKVTMMCQCKRREHGFGRRR